MKKSSIFVIVVIIAIVIVIIAIVMKPKTVKSPSLTNSSSQAASATVTYKNGFSPSSVTIMSGQSVTFKNDSSEDVQVDSNPHPTHTDNPELNVGRISSGQSQTVKLTTKGTWGYHNHLDPGDTGKIIVQ